MKYHLNFPLVDPPKRIFKNLIMRPPSPTEVHKILLRNDDLLLIFNNSLSIIHLNQNYEIIAQFHIDHPRLIKDLRNRLQDARKNGEWINAVGSAFLDNHSYICLCYYNNNLSTPEVYRYEKCGIFVDTLRMKELKVRSNHIIEACDNYGNLYGIDKEFAKVSISRIKKNSIGMR